MELCNVMSLFKGTKSIKYFCKRFSSCLTRMTPALSDFMTMMWQNLLESGQFKCTTMTSIVNLTKTIICLSRFSPEDDNSSTLNLLGISSSGDTS